MSGRNILGSERAHDVLTCRLCSQYLREPRQLPCGHTFCLACLERYYASECQRSADTARRRSPSVDRRRHRGLLPCPAAPVCLHVAVVPDDGVAGFPVNQRIADMKEHVVNEMAYNISKRIGRRLPHEEHTAESDTASVRSDETDLSDVSYQTTWSAPAGTTRDQPDATSSYPNLSKFAKYFETEKDGGSGSATKFTPSLRSERRRVAITSSFQHRRRRVHVPTSAAFDDSTSDLGSQHASRCGSAPHLDSDGVVYRPTVRPRQGSSIASPLLRRARPSSCIVEELADDRDLLHHGRETTSPTETPRRTASTDRHRQPLFREHVHLPTHLENISTDEIRRSRPAQDEPAGYGRHHSEDLKTGNISSKTAHNHDESLRPSYSEKVETGGKSSGTMPAKDEPIRHGNYMYHSEKVETGNKDTDTKPLPSRDESIRQHKQRSDYVETGATSSRRNTDGISGNTTGARIESLRNSKSHSDDLKTGKTSATTSSRASRRVLPNVPTDCNTAETRYDRGRQATSNTSTCDVRHARQPVARADKFSATERHNASSLGHRQKDPGVTKSTSTSTGLNKPELPSVNVSGCNKSNFIDTEPQKAHNSRLASHTASSSSRLANSTSVKSSSDSVQTKPSTRTKSHDVDHILKSSGSSTKSSTRDSLSPQKSQDSRKLSAHPNANHCKSTASGGKAHGAEQVKSSPHQRQTESDVHVSEDSKSARKNQYSQARTENTERRSKGSTVGEKSPPSAAKSRSSKSTPGSGSRLTYKVNAATIQPVLMNSKKTRRSSTDVGHQSPTKTATANDAEVSHHHYKEEVSTENVEMHQQNDNCETTCSHYSSDVSKPCASYVSASSDVSSQNKLNEDRCRQQSGVGGDIGDKPSERQDGRTSVSEPRQSGVYSQTNDRQPASPKQHTDSHSPLQRQAASDVRTPGDSVANDDKEDAKNSKKQQQWQGFMDALQATRAKYSSTENHSPSSESIHPLPVYSDSITPHWRIQRDDFAVPTSVAITSDGSSVIADIANCLLDFTDVEGNVVHSVTGTKPFSVAVNANDTIYVGDRRSRTVRVFDVYGSDVAQWDAETTGFGWIAGIAALHNGQLAIIDRERCKVSSVQNKFCYHCIVCLWLIRNVNRFLFDLN